MQPYSFNSKLLCRAFWLIGILLFAFPITSYCESAEGSTSSLQHGKLSRGELNLNYEQLRGTSNSAVHHRNQPNSPIVGTLRNSANFHQGTIAGEHPDAPNVRIKARRQDEILSQDCIAKQNEVLKRQNHAGTNQVRSSQVTTPTPGVGFQRIRPKLDNISNPTVAPNVSLAHHLDSEHVPRCRTDGSYDPIQCHKIGYCWCVNKFGQAIKNSAVTAGDEPDCDPSMYDSDSNYRFVVGGISTQRIKGILKNSSSFASTTPNGHVSFEATEPTSMDSVHLPTGELDATASQQVADASRLSSSSAHGPVMPLMFNNCSGSRANARERAAKQVNDSIWVPECDSENENLYAEQQCHKGRVCWCVDQTTGLPLRTSEQLSNQPKTHNCTEIKRILGLQTTSSARRPLAGSTGLATSAANPKQQQQQPHQVAFYQGSSEYCDTDKRVEFVFWLFTQFRQQISDYLRQNPSSMVPTDMSSTNPYLVSESQVARWKFRIMDEDMDSKIGDREWSRFKNNFKLVDKVAELDNPYKQQKSPFYSLTPLLIVRSQRKCWRDFLEFCGNGELVDESISLPMWMSCTEMPPRVAEPLRASISPSENTYALSREAAIVRSQKKNPFLGILKPD